MFEGLQFGGASIAEWIATLTKFMHATNQQLSAINAQQTIINQKLDLLLEKENATL